MSVHDKCRCVYVMSVKVREREGKGEGGRRVYRSGREVSVKVKRRLCQNPAGREHVPSCTSLLVHVLATAHIHACLRLYTYTRRTRMCACVHGLLSILGPPRLRVHSAALAYTIAY